MVVVLLRPLRPLQRPDLVAGHEHALLPAHQLQLRAWLQLGEAALVAVGDGGAAAGLDDDDGEPCLKMYSRCDVGH